MSEYDIGKRWENGVEHHPKSIELFKRIAEIDFEHMDDHFNWKSGGDGDNGEALMYLLDIYFEEKESSKQESREGRKVCSVEGDMVIPCKLLDRSVDNLYTRVRKGIFDLVVTDIYTSEQHTKGFGVKAGDFIKKGIMFNFCPFCGENISSHFVTKSGDNSVDTVDNSGDIKEE